MSTTRTWNYRNAAPPPTNGEVRTDTNAWATTTVVALSTQAASTVDVTSELSSIVVGSALRLELDSSNYADFTVSAIQDNTTYWTYTVTYQSGAGAPGNAPVTMFVSYDTSLAAPPPKTPYIVATIELNSQISLERYDVFLAQLQSFMTTYQHLIEDVRYDTSVPTIYTIPVLANAQGVSVQQLRDTMAQRLAGIPNVNITIGDIVDLSNPATPQWKPEPIVVAPDTTTHVESLVDTTAGTTNQRQGP